MKNKLKELLKNATWWFLIISILIVPMVMFILSGYFSWKGNYAMSEYCTELMVVLPIALTFVAAAIIAGLG